MKDKKKWRNSPRFEERQLKAVWLLNKILEQGKKDIGEKTV